MTDDIKTILKELKSQNAELFRISSKLNGHYVDLDRRVTKEENAHVEMRELLNSIKESIDNLQGVNDFFKGAGLLRKPLMLIAGFILAIVAVMGGLKTILTWFVLK